MIRLALCMLTLAVSACDAPRPAPAVFAATTVDYGQPVEEIAATAQISAIEAPSFYTAAKQGSASDGVQRSIMALVDADEPPPAPDFREATGRELVAFAAEHPDLLGDRNGICAQGSSLRTEDGLSGHPVISARDGRLYAGVWVNCYWRLLVATGDPVSAAP